MLPARGRLLAITVACAALAVGATGCAAATSGTSVAASESSLTPTPTPTPAPTVEASAADASILPAIPRPAVIVTIGDSIMSGYGLDPDEAWPVLLATKEDVSVTNLACAGAGFVRIGDCGTDFSGLIEQAQDQQPEMIIIQSSDNDAYEDESSISTATTDTIRALHKAVPSAHIVGLSTIWNLPYEPPETIAAASASLQAAVEAVGGTFVDVGDPLRDQPTLLQDDEEHPTVAGQQALLAAITDALQSAGLAL